MHSFLKSNFANYNHILIKFQHISIEKKKMHPNAHLLNFWVGSV